MWLSARSVGVMIQKCNNKNTIPGSIFFQQEQQCSTHVAWDIY